MTGPTAALLVWILLGLSYAAAVWRLAHQGDDDRPSASGHMDPGVVDPTGRRIIGIVSSAAVGRTSAARAIPHAALVEPPALAFAPQRRRVDSKARGRLFERRALR
jgi:hypothetical protein